MSGDVLEARDAGRRVRGAAAGAGSAAALRASRRRAVRRDATVIAVLALGAILLFTLSLMLGARFVPLDEVLAVLRGERVPGVSFSVGTIRLPRALGALLAGAAFGLGGVLFQTLLRNVLASPDVIGIASGASAAAVVAIGFFAASGVAVMIAAMGGSLATALLIWAVAYRRGLSGLRFVLAGVAVGAGLQAVIAYALTRTDVHQAQQAIVWMTGSLSRSLWDQLRPIAPVLIALLALGLLVAHRLPVLALGEDAAKALGLREQRDRLALIAVAVLLVSVATALTGPIAFTAFLSGPIAARLVRRPGSLPLAAALVGALVVMLADLVGQHAFPSPLPVGVITGAIGAPILILLLMRGRTRV